MKKKLSIAIVTAMALSLLAGCGGGGTSGGGNTAAPAENAPAAEAGSEAAADSTGGSVYWLNFKPESDEVLQEIAATYTDLTGVPVKVVTAASGTYNQTLNAEMDKSAPPTLFVVGNQAGVKDWADYVIDLTGTPIANELNTDAYNLYDESGKLVSIGYCYECYGIIANPDLIEQAGHSIDEITNFETLKAVAEDIHARASELGFDAFSASDMDPSSSWRFTGHMANLEYYYESRDAGGWTECPPEISGAYMENFKNLYDLCINNSTVAPTDLATGGHDAEAEFKEGKAAFFVNGSWEYSAVSETVPNATMIPYYCGVEGEEKAGLNCGTENCWAINANVSEADQQATMDFLVWCVTDPDASRKLVDSFGIMPYKNAAESTNGFLQDAADYTANGCYVMDWVTNYQPNVDDYRAALVSALNQYNADQSDANWELVRTAFVDGWATQYGLANN
ncbi:MAG: ABC transporter substrate-binding protein [Lachnospiraceae bacterium]|nr:ABC transporter substrate-binding protein [Lachnospiraceae bacterium]